MELSNCDTSSLGGGRGSHIFQYDDQFPPLPVSNVPKKATTDWKVRSPTTQCQSKTTLVTQTLVVPLSERRFTGRDGSSNNDTQKKICLNVAQKCAVSIELNGGLKDQSLTLFITGAPDKVTEAKKILAKELQSQGQIQIKVPKQYHKFILGRNGASLREIENNSSTNITIPRASDESDLVSIFGTKQGLERARLDILHIVNERSKLATERFAVPRRLYPFINGPNNVNISRIRELTNVKINIPPPGSATDNDEIVVSGDKDGVLEAVSIIKKICDDTTRNCSSLNLAIPKSQHRYVIGPKGSGLCEILDKTGVSVEMPPLESEDDTIVLYGPNERLAPALSLVIQKAESMMFATLSAPHWLHRFIIGKSGVNLNKILENYERVFVNFQDECDLITIEGPKEDVKELRTIIETRIEELKLTMDSVQVQVDPRFHRHIIGRSGTNIQRLQDDYKVQIRMPGSGTVGDGSWTVRIEGTPDGVRHARCEIEAICAKLENEKTTDVVLDHKYHNQLIGAHGSNIKELRALFPDVSITFPDSALKSDLVQLRGPRVQVDHLATKLNHIVQEVVENNFVSEVRIWKQYHRHIIGKGGSNIRRVRDETGVRVDFPDEQSDSDVIRLTGRKANVEEAVAMIESLQSELVSIKEDSISIPKKLHPLVTGVRGKLIKAIQDQCGGGVIIQFPAPESKSDLVIIRGPESDVIKAKKMVRELSEKHQTLTFQDTVSARSDLHRFLMGRKGALMADFRRRYNVMVLFPDNEDVNKDEVQIVGAKEAVLNAKMELENMVKALENEEERVVSVDPKWHKHFFKRRQALLEELGRDFGGVRLFFPKLVDSDSSDKVRVVGPKGCVEGAIARIKEIVDNLEAQTSILVFIEQCHHKSLIVRNMAEIKAIQTEFEVAIKFPSKTGSSDGNMGGGGGGVRSGGAGDVEIDTFGAGSMDHQSDGTSWKVNEGEIEDSEMNNNPANWVAISGRKENCELAKESLLELVPVSEDVPLCNEFHRNFIGQKGQGINSFSSKYGVSVNIPQANLGADHISVKGTMANIIEAKKALKDMEKVWETEKIDRIARNFELAVEVPVRFHRHIIGQRGTNIDMFRNKFNVNIQMPDQSSGSSSILIRGYEEEAQKAAEELRNMVTRLEAQVKEELHIPREVHPLLIGSRGVNLKKLRDQFKVDINFPNKSAEGDKAELVEVIGDKEDVDHCCDHLIARANELLEELEDRTQFRGTQTSSGTSNNIQNKQEYNNDHTERNQTGFLVAGAPWQRVPDSFSNDDFPTIDGAGDRTTSSSSSSHVCMLNGLSK